jgi:hypothetical protein
MIAQAINLKTGNNAANECGTGMHKRNKKQYGSRNDFKFDDCHSLDDESEPDDDETYIRDPIERLAKKKMLLEKEMNRTNLMMEVEA